MDRIYLDCDGVLSPLGTMFRDEWGDFIAFETEEHTLHLSPSIGQRLQDIQQRHHVEIVWCSWWCDYPEWLDKIATVVGLQDCRQITLDDSWKAGAIYQDTKDLTEDDKVIWIDDDEPAALHRFHLRVRPDSNQGLTRTNLFLIEDYLRY